MRKELNCKDFQDAIDTSLSGLQPNPWLSQRIMNSNSQGDNIQIKKLSFSLVLIFILIIISITAFALSIGLGLLDFAGARKSSEIPQDASKYIMHELGTLETSHFSVKIREGYFDGKTVHLLFDAIPGNKDMFVLPHGPGMDESWYGITHVKYDPEQDSGKTISDIWNDSNYTSCWSVDISIETNENTTYNIQSIVNEDTGILTGELQFSFSELKAERTVVFCFVAAPLMDIQDEESWDYDQMEYEAISLQLHAAYSGNEHILCNIDPVLLTSVGIQIDSLRLIVLANEIQYQLDFSISDPNKYFSCEPLSFRFVEADDNGAIRRFLQEGISNIYEGKDHQSVTGYLGISEISETYSIAIYAATSTEPQEIVSIPVQYEAIKH